MKTFVVTMLLIALYVAWIVHAYHNPPVGTCLLEGCHFTLLGWSAGQ